MEIKKPKFKEIFDIKIIPEIGLIFESERKTELALGKIHLSLYYMIDGINTVDRIVDCLSNTFTIPEIYFSLEQLERLELIEEATKIRTKSELYYDLVIDELGQSENTLNDLKVYVINYSKVTNHQIDLNFKENNVQIVDDIDQAILVVVLVDDYLNPLLAKINEEMLAKEKKWLLCKLTGTIIWIGPFFHPNYTGCWACLENRLMQQKVYPLNLKEAGLDYVVETTSVFLPSTLQIAFGMLLTNIITFILAKNNAKSTHSLTTYDTIKQVFEKHVLIKRPQCSVCGRNYETNMKPIVLSRKQSIPIHKGRELDVETMYVRIKHHISPITGIVKKIQQNQMGDVPGLFRLQRAEHTFIQEANNIKGFYKSFYKASGGKGYTTLHAKVTAICEALERYSGTLQEEDKIIRASYIDLIEQSIHPNDCMLYSENQFKNRVYINKIVSDINYVPMKLSDHEEIGWTPVWSLTGNGFKYLPTAYCYYSGEKAGVGASWIHCSSNGSASGSSFEEAVLYAFFELFERDAVSIWWYNRVKRPAVDLSVFSDSFIEKMQEYYHSIGRELWVLDITNDLGVPVFVALSRRVDTPAEDIIYGFGAHFDPLSAIKSALMEINQTLPLVLQKTPKGETKYISINKECMDWLKNATIENQPYLSPLEETSCIKKYNLYKELDTYSAIQECIRAVKDAGLEAYVLDQTRLDIGLPVAKVFVPGLRHFWKRFAPGRLYDVPVKLEWLSKSKQETELNPYSVFF